MKLLDLAKAGCQHFSEPQMLAKAFADYFYRVWLRQQEVAMYLGDLDQDVDSLATIANESSDGDLTSLGNKVVPIALDGVTYNLRVSEIKPLIQEAYHAAEENGDETPMITITDCYDHNLTREVSLEELFTTISSYVDSTWITWKAYDSLVVNAEQAGEVFHNTCQTYMKNVTSGDIIYAVDKIYNSLVSKTGSLFQKITAISEFTGLSLFTENPEGSVADDRHIGVEDYTGKNPVLGWIGGIDIDMSSVANFVGSVVKAAASCIYAVWKTVAKFLGGICTKLFGWFKKTFVNPNDVSLIEGNQYEYFDIPAKMVGKCSNSDPTWKKIYEGGEDDSSRTVFMQYAGCVYEMVARKIDNVNYLFVTRWTKPLNTSAIYDLVKSSVSDQTFNSIDTLITPNEILTILQGFQSSDLSLPKDASEGEIYRGVYLATYLQDCIAQILYNTYSAPRSELQADITQYMDLPIGSIVEQLSNDYTKGIFSGLGNAMRISKICSSKYSASLPSWFCEIAHERGQNVQTTQSLNTSPNEVTNKDFLKLLTLNWLTPEDDGEYSVRMSNIYCTNVHNEAPFYGANYNATYVTSFYALDTSFSNSYLLSAWGNKFYRSSGSPAACSYYYSEKLNESEETEGVYIPYSRTPNYDFKRNCTLKTDDENAEAVGNFLVKLAIVVTVVVVAAAATKAITTVLRKFNTLGPLAAANERRLGDILRDPNATQDQIDEAYKAYKNSKLKVNLANAVTGNLGTTKSNGDLLVSSTDDSRIASLIDPNYR